MPLLLDDRGLSKLKTQFVFVQKNDCKIQESGGF